MGAFKTAVLLVGVAATAAVFHLVPCASSQPVSVAPNKHVSVSNQVSKVLEEEKEEEKKSPPESFENLVLMTETARQKAAIAAALAQEYMNGERIISNKYSRFFKMAETKNNSAEEYEEWSEELEQAAAELLAEEEERLKLAEKVEKHASDYARLSRRSQKDARVRALNATFLESRAKSTRALAADLFARSKLKHERAEDYIDRAREEDNIALELQRQATELTKLAEEHRIKASYTAAKAQQLEDSAYEDEVSATKHEKEANILERGAEEAKAADRESSFIATEYLIRRIDKQCKSKRLRVGARNLHALAEVYGSEANTLRGIAKRDRKDTDYYRKKASLATKQKALYHKTTQTLLALSRKYTQDFKERLKKSNKVAAEKGYQYAIVHSP